MQTKLLTSSPHDIAIAASLLQSGHNVAFPTETVYGLGASVFCQQALQNIFYVKGRPQDNPLIVHVGSFAHVMLLAKRLPIHFRPLFDAFFPGPLTLVVEKSENVPAIAAAGLHTIGIRMPSHPVALALIQAAGVPLAAPSANLSGSPSSTTVDHVLADFSGKIPAIVDGGPCSIGIESTVISLVSDTPVILRPGLITLEQIENVLQVPVLSASGECQKVLSPGMKYRHYAPKASVELFSSWPEIKQRLNNCCSKILILTKQERREYTTQCVAPLCIETLYSELRRADIEGFSRVFVELCPTALADIALCNRLYKAAGWT